jgi:hypothetical protein
MLCPLTLVHYQGSFPSTPTLRGPRVSKRGKIAPAANYCCPKSYIHCAPGPTCQGPTLLYMPPLSYKRGSMQRYKGGIFRPRSSRNTLRLPQAYTRLKLSSNTTHSGVGYYAPAVRTTLNSCVFLCSSLRSLTSKRLKPPPHLRT